jgi:phage-related protein
LPPTLRGLFYAVNYFPFIILLFTFVKNVEMQNVVYRQGLAIKVPENLLTTWQTLTRHGDIKQMANDLSYSKVTIGKALRYGNCSRKVQTEITQWLLDKRKNDLDANALQLISEALQQKHA